jgi:hypothetical protein
MWSKLDDNILHHDKTESAARRLGPRGIVLALGTVTFGLVYCNWKLTDGFVHNDVLDRYGVDPELRRLMVEVRFWHPERDGYRIHDFHEFNPSASAVKARRAKDRLRKQSRAGFHADSTRNPDGIPTESTWNPRGFHNASQSRADPVPSRPSTTSPTPPPAEGPRRPRAQRQAALRAQGPPPARWRDRCQHTPTCSTPEACRLKGDRGIA